MTENIFILSDKSESSQKLAEELMLLYPNILTKKITKDSNILAILVLGGDGFMLHSIHKYMEYNLPFYGINCGSLGFLLNEYKAETNIIEKLKAARRTDIHPLLMKSYGANNETSEFLAFNDVSLLRETKQSAHIKIITDGICRLPKLVSDGILIATPAGSTAYNFAVRGPIIPLSCDVLAMTPIAPFRPRQWRGALLHEATKITFEILTPEKRPVSAVADFYEFRDVRKVEVSRQANIHVTLLFDHDNPLEDKIFLEQFET
ncbi:MAG: NAD kinase [Rickettsiales bacterium]|jgi:NAD+ kinase|nr:NAD kinase [Rickettsiales bacterium]